MRSKTNSGKECVRSNRISPEKSYVRHKCISQSLWRVPVAMQLSRIVFAAFIVLPLVSPLADRRSLAQTATPHVKPGHQGALAEPLLTGSDGSQTGVAKFQGNLTAISAPSGQGLVLSRQPDCSLSLFTGTIALTPNFSYSSTGFFADYDRVLHSNAGLASTPGVFSSGCSSPTTGLGSRRGVYVGQTTAGNLVFASIYYNPALGNNALLVSSGITGFTWTSFSFAAAGTLTSADLNGDGNGDLIIVNGNNGGTATAQIFVLLGNPDGTFQTAVPYAVPGTASISAVIDDVNGDGKLDIVASSDNGQISVFTGKGDGTFNAAQSFAAPSPVYPGSTLTPSTSLTNLITADLRGSGKKDIIASNGLVLLNDGAGNFTAASSAAFPPLTGFSSFGPNLATGDLNKDGKLDLVVSLGGSVLTYLGKGDGTFSPGANYVTVNTDGFVNVSDLDGDGNLDIYIGEANGGFYFGDDINLSYALMGNGDGTFQGAPTIPGSYTGTNLGDVNGDGQLDLITPTSGTFNGLPAVFTVELGTSKGSFNPGSTITLPSTIVVNGFNGPTTLSTTGAVASSFAVGDLNGDGKADLAFVIQTLPTVPTSGFSTQFPSPIVFVALSNGDGTFATPVPFVFPQIAPASGFDISLTADSLHIGDFNHDGHNDLAFTFNEVAGGSSPIATPYNTGYVVLPGIGNGTFGAPIITTTSSTSTAPVFAVPSTIFSTVDVNKDGNSDLLAMTNVGTPATGFSSQLQIYLSKGDGTFQAPITPSTAANPGLINTGTPCTLVDLNKDTKLDLICFGETTAGQAQLAISLGNGDGTFGTATILNVGGGDAIRSSGLTAADFDGDGNVDLALIDGADFSGIFYGKGDGTFTSIPLNGNAVPKDLINLASIGSAIAVDLNKDGKPDILVGNAILLNTYATAPTIVTQFNTTTALTASATSIAHGSSVTFTATVAPASGSTGTPTGSVLFADGDLTIGSATVDATGKATFSTTALAAGSHSITAGFGGSTTLLGSVSSTVSVTVGPAAPGIATTTTLAASTATAVSGGSVTFTATVTPASGTAVPTGAVTFSDGGTALGNGTLDASGKATFSTSTLSVGAHSITAAYGGATTPTAFSNSASSTVNVTITNPPIIATTTALTASATTATSGTSLTFTATVTPASGTTTPTGTITFNDGSTALGTGTLDGTGKATFVTTTLTVGSHTITAAYGGAATFAASTSTGLAIVITSPTQDFTLALSPTSVSVARGATVGSMLTITGGANQSFTLTCTGAPTNSTCGVGSALALTNGNTSATVAVTFNAFVTTTSSLRRAGNIQAAALLPFGLIGSVALFAFGRRRTRTWPLHLMAIIGISLFAITGCGGGGNKSTTTNPAAGTYPLTITVTSGAINHTATFTVTVQ
jgi:hypothetical protein